MFNIPNLFTAANLVSGLIAIILSLMGRIDLAPFAIFAGGLFDFFDGFLARKLNKTGELGKQLDSLADLVTFGVAPGMFMLVVMVVSTSDLRAATMSPNFATHVNFLLTNWKNNLFFNVPNSVNEFLRYTPFFALFIPFMSMFRLAKFNIDKRQTESFIGLNTPTNTLFFTTFPLILMSEYSPHGYQNEWICFLFQPGFFIVLIGCMSLLLISEIPMFSLKFKHFKWAENQIKYVFLINSTLLIVFLLVWSIPLIVLLYLLLSVYHTKTNKKAKDEIQSRN
jgi:CDP-diacylglycerol---serine O-phosphatidyltransferase